ncbi:Cutin hydrolase [Cladobotryum mycophilum]|uniref:cutinase n=1 Tax=Cladobotryum mycophilum TaxID=491253 RepID=A0ABR0SW11_9HYPO
MRIHSFLAGIFASQVLAYPSDMERTDSLEWTDLTAAIGEVIKLVPVNILTDDFCHSLTIVEKSLVALFGIQDTEKDGQYGDVTVLFARATCESGNVGVLVGPFLKKELQKRLGNKTVALQGAKYPGIIEDYYSPNPENGKPMADMIKSTIANCPNTKIVVGGFSQGCMVAHDAMDFLDADSASKVKAFVTFGDPYSQKAVAQIDQSKVKIYCHVGDNICVHGPLVLPQHVTYGLDVADAASFIISQL